MKRYYYFLIVFGILATSCGTNSERENEGDAKESSVHEGESTPDIEGLSELRTPQEEVGQEEIALAELPEVVIDEIKSDSLLATFEMQKAIKIVEGSKVYYDITLRTEDDEQLIVSVDDKGEIIDN